MRMKRSVWSISTEPFPEAHFATFPTALITPAILAGTSAKGCCPECGAQWERITRKVFQQQPDAPNSALRAEGQTLGDPAFNRREGSTRGTVEHTTLASTDFSFAPKTGEMRIAAYSMPGCLTSMP